MIQRMLSHVFFGAVLVGVFFGLVYWLQPTMVFLPLARLEATPAQWGLEYEDVSIQTADGVQLHGWFVPSPGADCVLLFFHGNAGNISHRRESIEIFHRLGLSVLIIDYRGYGASGGRPTEAGLHLDAAAAWDYLVEQREVSPDRIIVFGRSLGGVVAAQLAAQTAPAALILESTFSSARAFIRATYGWLGGLIPSRFAFDTAGAVTRVRCPVLVLHSPDDEIVPFALGREVFAAAKPPKTFVALRGDHNRGFLLSQPEYSRALAAFLADHVLVR